jgi:hypothetical protein
VSGPWRSGRKPMEDSEIEWHRSQFSDLALAFLWSFVIVSLIVFIWATSDIGAILMITIALVLAVMVATVNLYHVSPYLVGIAEDRIVFRHRYRFRKPKYQELAYSEITRLDFERPKGAVKMLYTVEGQRGLRIPDEAADRILNLWKEGRGDSKDA